MTRVVSATPTTITLDVDVAADAKPGPRDVSSSPARVSAGGASAVLRQAIDGIKVTPQAGHGARRRRGVSRSSCSSSRRSRSPTDRTASRTRPTTCSSASVDVKWSLEEYTATFDDDDLKFVGTLDPDRAVHAERRRPESRSAAASATTSATSGSSPSSRRTGAGLAKPLRARAHLLVTVPVYMRWFDAGGRRR